MTNWKKYAFWFAQEHIEFRFAEIDSIAKALNVPINIPTTINTKLPYWLVELPNEHAAKQIASRSISLRCILEIWSYSTKIPHLHSELQKFVKENQAYAADLFDQTFKITVETYNKHFSQKEKVDKIETFNYLPMHGGINLRTPAINWWYIEYYGLDPTNVPDEPFAAIFGKWIADGQRSLLKEMSLKNRKFIGNTSMDAQLSLLMANQALAKPGDLILDPFVGTGSLLVAAAKFGAYVMGSDIDFLMLHARSRPSRISQKVREKDESIRANLRQYGCDNLYMDVMVSDFSKSVWMDNLQFSSIITDPPYGIREAVEKIEPKHRTKPNTQTENDVHYPSTSPYLISDLYTDLLSFSAKHLQIGGRLVCWLPIYKNDFNENMLPQHPCLRLIFNSEQNISALTSRRLLTYEKYQQFQDQCQPDNKIGNGNLDSDFRQKFFYNAEETRQERRIRRAELREIGRQEALNRGKILDGNGRVIKPMTPS